MSPLRLRPRVWRTWLIGRPLPTADAPHQRIGKGVGLAVFASDNLSSTAYATQEILLVLSVAGTAAFAYAFPIALAIAGLLVILTVSYWQTIHAYPNGGGAYIVARENLGETAAQVAGAALLVDYVLTVAVSVASGVAQITSAFPVLSAHRVSLSVAAILIIMIVNLRGVRESGITFSVPTYFFVVTMFITIGVGIFRWLTGSLGHVTDPPAVELAKTLAPVGPFLILHAFSNGTTAVTGVEAISNGIPAFKEPRARNAAVTLLWMASILGTLFLAITFLAIHTGTVPSEAETIISQLARTVFDGRGLLYLATVGGMTLILIMAANTSFADFPRLSALQAADGFLPRQLTYRGSRLVYSHGIELLALLACALIVVFRASVTALIPLYCIGVFLSFTLSQAGMTRHWWKLRRTSETPPRAWIAKLAVNAIGGCLSAVVVAVFAVTKFTEGAWIVIVVIPVLVLVFFAINRHYRDVGVRLAVKSGVPRVGRQRVLVPISSIHQGALEALNYARSLSIDVTAVHVSLDATEAARFQEDWKMWGDGVRLVVLESPYRLLLEPLLAYIDRMGLHRQAGERLIIVVPQLVTERKWHNLLHAQTAVFLRLALMYRPGIVITNVPYHLEPRIRR